MALNILAAHDSSILSSAHTSPLTSTLRCPRVADFPTRMGQTHLRLAHPKDSARSFHNNLFLPQSPRFTARHHYASVTPEQNL